MPWAGVTAIKQNRDPSNHTTPFQQAGPSWQPHSQAANPQPHTQEEQWKSPPGHPRPVVGTAAAQQHAERVEGGAKPVTVTSTTPSAPETATPEPTSVDGVGQCRLARVVEPHHQQGVLALRCRRDAGLAAAGASGAHGQGRFGEGRVGGYQGTKPVQTVIAHARGLAEHGVCVACTPSRPPMRRASEDAASSAGGGGGSNGPGGADTTPGRRVSEGGGVQGTEGSSANTAKRPNPSLLHALGLQGAPPDSPAFAVRACISMPMSTGPGLGKGLLGTRWSLTPADVAGWRLLALVWCSTCLQQPLPAASHRTP